VAAADRVVPVDAQPHRAGIAEYDVQAVLLERQLVTLAQDLAGQELPVAGDLDVARSMDVDDAQRRRDVMGLGCRWLRCARRRWQHGDRREQPNVVVRDRGAGTAGSRVATDRMGEGDAAKAEDRE